MAALNVLTSASFASSIVTTSPMSVVTLTFMFILMTCKCCLYVYEASCVCAPRPRHRYGRPTSWSPTHDLSSGGAERLVVDAAIALQAHGHSVSMFTSHHDPAHCFAETRDGTYSTN